jgi:cytochrome P450
LADQPQLQEEVFAEVTQLYPHDRPLEYSDLDRFPLTFACAQESMRIVPVAPYLLLESYQDTAIEGYCIPKGTMIFALLAAKGLDDMAFDRSEQFIPQRWLNLTEQDKKRHANELMPFGFGARLCPGRQLSFVEMKVALIELIRHFRFSRTPGSHVTQTLAFTVMPTDLKVDIQSR